MNPGLLLLSAVLALLLGLAGARRSARLWLVGLLSGSGLGLAAALSVLAGAGPWDWRPEFAVGGEAVHLRLDSLGAFFLALLSVLAGAGGAFGHGYWPASVHPRSAPQGRVAWLTLVLCMGTVLVTSNGLHFLIVWELFTLSAYFLITAERHRPEVRRAGWLYLAASHAGALCLFAFFAALAARTGSWDLGPRPDQPELAPLFWLALAGFGIKAGLFPLHIWLPSAHANAPSHVSAMLSGMALKMGIYGLVRFTGWLPLPSAAGWVLLGLGLVSAVLGVAFALGQHDLKRLLAYHSVENIGIILMGLGFAIVARSLGSPVWGQLAFAGGLLHVWNHGLFKALLFLGAGAVVHATGTRTMSRLGGLWRQMPWTTAAFGLGSVAIVGLPPLNGFVSEWLVYLSFFDALSSRGPAAVAAAPAAMLLGLTGALALACFVKVCGVVFLGLPRSAAAAGAREVGRSLRWPMGVLAGACLIIGLAPALCWPALARAAGQWNPAWQDLPQTAPLSPLGIAHAALAVVLAITAIVVLRGIRRGTVRRAVTWDCGYVRPAPRMQYTAGSFAAILTEWFAWILRPERHGHGPDGHFPTRSAWSSHTPETVLERVILPLAAVIMAASNAVRRLQHGRLQAYLLYLVLGLAALAVLVALGGDP